MMWSRGLECGAHNPEAPMAETFSARSPISKLPTRHLTWVTQDLNQYGRPVAYHSAYWTHPLPQDKLAQWYESLPCQLYLWMKLRFAFEADMLISMIATLASKLPPHLSSRHQRFVGMASSVIVDSF